MVEIREMIPIKKEEKQEKKEEKPPKEKKADDELDKILKRYLKALEKPEKERSKEFKEIEKIAKKYILTLFNKKKIPESEYYEKLIFANINEAMDKLAEEKGKSTPLKSGEDIKFMLELDYTEFKTAIQQELDAETEFIKKELEEKTKPVEKKPIPPKKKPTEKKSASSKKKTPPKKKSPKKSEKPKYVLPKNHIYRSIKIATSNWIRDDAVIFIHEETEKFGKKIAKASATFYSDLPSKEKKMLKRDKIIDAKMLLLYPFSFNTHPTPITIEKSDKTFGLSGWGIKKLLYAGSSRFTKITEKAVVEVAIMLLSFIQEFSKACAEITESFKKKVITKKTCEKILKICIESSTIK